MHHRYPPQVNFFSFGREQETLRITGIVLKLIFVFAGGVVID